MSTETPENLEPNSDSTPAPAEEPTPTAEAPVTPAQESVSPTPEPVASDAPAAEPVPEEAPAAEPLPEVPEEGAVQPAFPGLDIGSQAMGDGGAPLAEPTIRGKIDRFGTAIGTGRRKTSVARVRISDGDGKLVINGRELKEYFTLERDQEMVLAPLKATDTLGKVDVWVKVNGGGPTGQTGAVLLGIARALQVRNPGLHHILSEGGYLTRDGRMVERKKYGLRKARRSFQFSKR